VADDVDGEIDFRVNDMWRELVASERASEWCFKTGDLFLILS